MARLYLRWVVGAAVFAGVLVTGIFLWRRPELMEMERCLGEREGEGERERERERERWEQHILPLAGPIPQVLKWEHHIPKIRGS